MANKVDFENPKNVLIASTMLVLGLGGAVISITSGNLNIPIKGMSLAAVFGILLNLVIPDTPVEETTEDVEVPEPKKTTKKVVKEAKEVKETKTTKKTTKKTSTKKAKK